MSMNSMTLELIPTVHTSHNYSDANETFSKMNPKSVMYNRAMSKLKG
jgi:hypothetical protein